MWSLTLAFMFSNELAIGFVFYCNLPDIGDTILLPIVPLLPIDAKLLEGGGFITEELLHVFRVHGGTIKQPQSICNKRLTRRQKVCYRSVMDHLRTEAIHTAWKLAKHVEAMWARMGQEERTKVLADMRRWRHVLDRMGA